MSRGVQLVLLCEDRQHETFVRRFLEKAGWSTRRMRVEMAPPGKGSAEQFVRDRFPNELAAYRSNRNRVAQGLIVVRDGDNKGVTDRIQELSNACVAEGIEPRRDDEAVAILIPTWNIEAWLAYLGGSSVDDTKGNYPRLDRARDCQPYVEALHDMCQQGVLRRPAPASLEAACTEYRKLIPSSRAKR
ncbi:hypothetical protein SH661x_004344 [Planctomicrobium sp. SH661]|uniref:hypothetical protein n=1 Tax=Planctomicrobium sp. SH661 TaxID=3448124 RepID=UPI003F5C88C6